MNNIAATICGTAGQLLRPCVDKTRSSSLRQRLVQGAFWSFFGSVVSRGLMFASAIIIARLLNKEIYGEFGMIRSTVDMFGVFAGFGLSLTATRHISEYKASDPERAGRLMALLSAFSIVTGGAIALALYFFAPWIATETLKAPHLTLLIQISTVSLFFSALNGAQTGALSGLEAFRAIAKVNALVGVVSFVVQIAATWYFGLTGAVWGMAAGLCLNWLLNHLALRQEMKKWRISMSFRRCAAEGAVLWSCGLPSAISGLLVSPVNWVCNSMVVGKTGGFSDLGIYTAAISISLVISVMNNIIDQVMLPVTVTQLNQKHRKFEFVNIILPWLVGITLTLPFVFIPELGMTLFGKGYAERRMFDTVILVMFSALIIAHRQGISRNFIAGKYMWWSLLGNGFWGVSALIFTWLFAGHGAVGRAGAMAIAYALNTAVFIPFYINRKLCSRELLLSRECLSLWGILVASFAVNLTLSMDVSLRGLLFAAALGTCYFITYRWWQRYNAAGLEGAAL